MRGGRRRRTRGALLEVTFVTAQRSDCEQPLVINNTFFSAHHLVRVADLARLTQAAACGTGHRRPVADQARTRRAWGETVTKTYLSTSFCKAAGQPSSLIIESRIASDAFSHADFSAAAGRGRKTGRRQGKGREQGAMGQPRAQTPRAIGSPPPSLPSRTSLAEA